MNADMLDELSAFPVKLKDAVAAAGPHLRVRSRDGHFAMVEQLCHLGDLEREGYGARIERLLSGEPAEWDDFDGEAVARERSYLEQNSDHALQRFIEARATNIARLNTATDDDWQRRGLHRGLGEVTLRRIAEMMVEHDRSHEAEIENLLAELESR
jgi:DinB superfamily